MVIVIPLFAICLGALCALIWLIGGAPILSVLLVYVISGNLAATGLFGWAYLNHRQIA
ncbi:hypothetical protein ACFSUD_09670 [Sulfitobacter aestuarii]|uniref:Uncharacterized protein n=1 Tax=Sulfitobacter aestuarii TaxID=2161676 RepID=A0ABW5U475_9RHOB